MIVKTLVFILAALALAPTAAAAQPDPRPKWIWSIDETRNGEGDVRLASDRQRGRLVEKRDFGPAAFDFLRPPDGRATGEINGSASGITFDVYAQSASGTVRGAVIGGKSHLEQKQSYKKRSGQASIALQVTQATINAIDASGGLLPTECPPSMACQPVRGDLRFEAVAFKRRGGTFFRTGGVAHIHGYQGNWDLNAATFGDSKRRLWDPTGFNLDPDADGTGSGSRAFLGLRRKLTIRIPLKRVKRGRRFAVRVVLDANVVDHRGRESMVEAFLRDPRRADGLIKTRGLKALGPPAFEEPPRDPLPPAECPQGADPESGTLQLSAPSYTTYESDAGGPFVLVTRTGGSTGAASATVTTTAGSATAGTDYTDVGTTVRFGDGDSSPRLVEIPIADDTLAEEHEMLNVSLANAACAPLGGQTTAEVTIIDDDSAPELPPSFTIGGTVSGLEGSGLVLANLGSPLAIAGNGSFEFSPPVADRIPYEVSVATQPSDPDQVCTVANGSGNVAGADVTDIAVDCVTPPPPSGLDPDFGGDGKVSTAGTGRGQAVAIQPDGMIVTAGGIADFTVTRHTPDGDLDPAFGGGDGIVTTNISGTDEAFDVAIDSEDRIVVVGRSSSPNRDVAVVRYLPNGDPDPAFGGGDGIVTTDFNAGADEAKSVALQSDGMIVVAGNAQTGAPLENDFAVVRYEEDGDVDMKVTTDLGTSTDLGNAVALDAEGRIVVAGQVDQSKDFALVRYEADGAVDADFSGGIVISDFGGNEVIKGLAIRPDGRIVVAGSTTAGATDLDVAVAQYGGDGVLDQDFGLVTTDLSNRVGGDDFAEDLALAADGRILVVGRNTSDTSSDLAVVRYDEDGELDESFDGDGVLLTDFHGAQDVGQDIAIQADGRIVAAGQATNGFATEFALLRALP